MPILSAGGQLRPLHPFHAILLAFPLPLFLGALLSDLAYASSFHVQWINFSSWLIAGGLLGGGFALLWALIDLFVAELPGPDGMVYFVVLLVMWVLGFINALVHAKDAWATMPDRPLSVVHRDAAGARGRLDRLFGISLPERWHDALGLFC